MWLLTLPVYSTNLTSSWVHRDDNRIVDRPCSFFSQPEAKYITFNRGAIHMHNLLIANGLSLYPDTIRTQGRIPTRSCTTSMCGGNASGRLSYARASICFFSSVASFGVKQWTGVTYARANFVHALYGFTQGL